MNLKVPFGPASIVGYAGAAAAAVIAVVEALEANGVTPGSVKWLTIVSAALAAITNFGRQHQAALSPEPVVVAIPPDGVDSAKVPSAKATKK